MKFHRKKRNRRSLRLRGYDYSQAGAYFVTICIHGQDCLFGQVVEGETRLSEYGGVVSKCWNELSFHYPYVETDEYAVMPNHLHGIIVITASTEPDLRSTHNHHALGQIVGYFKYQSTKEINERRRTPGARVWQRNYYEHVIRSEDELNRIRKYIAENPLKWEMDPENPEGQKPKKKEAWEV